MDAANIIIMRGAKALRITAPEVPVLDDEQESSALTMYEAQSLLLWSDPGAGKTLTAIRALEHVEENMGAPPGVLILCPPVAVYTWLRWLKAVYQANGWGAYIQVIDKGNRAVTPEATHVVIPYSLISRNPDKLYDAVAAWLPDVLICDESDNLTGWTAARTRFVFGADFDKGVSKLATYRWMLTGTPIPRYNDGLYPVLRNLFPQVLKGYGVFEAEAFLETFTWRETVKYGKMRMPKKNVAGSVNNKLLRQMLFDPDRWGGCPLVIRNKLKLGTDLLEIYKSLDFDLSKELVKLEDELSEVPEDGEARTVDPRMATALRKLGEEMAPHVAADIAADMEDKRAKGDKRGMLVLHWHKSVGNLLTAYLQQHGYKVAQMNGATKADADAITEADFNAGKLDFVVGQIKAMGVAINLQENANDVRFAEDSFSDAANQQAYQRVYRRGQKDVVSVTYYRALQSSLADMRPRVAKRKREGAKKVLDNQ